MLLPKQTRRRLFMASSAQEPEMACFRKRSNATHSLVLHGLITYLLVKRLSKLLVSIKTDIEQAPCKPEKIRFLTISINGLLSGEIQSPLTCLHRLVSAVGPVVYLNHCLDILVCYSLLNVCNCCWAAPFTFTLMASTVVQKDNAAQGCTVHVVEEADLEPFLLYQGPPRLPIWPRVLTAGLHIVVVLSTAIIIGLLAHTFSDYTRTRGIRFGGSNNSWPADLDLHPAVIYLTVASISLLASLVWAFLTICYLRRPTFSSAEMASVMLSLVLLVLWIAADLLEAQSEQTPKRSLLSWACRRGSSPTNVIVRYGSICAEQVSVLSFDVLLRADDH